MYEAMCGVSDTPRARELPDIDRESRRCVNILDCSPPRARPGPWCRLGPRAEPWGLGGAWTGCGSRAAPPSRRPLSSIITRVIEVPRAPGGMLSPQSATPTGETHRPQAQSAYPQGQRTIIRHNAQVLPAHTRGIHHCPRMHADASRDLFVLRCVSSWRQRPIGDLDLLRLWLPAARRQLWVARLSLLLCPWRQADDRPATGASDV
jgi:hypothetical protein